MKNKKLLGLLLTVGLIAAVGVGSTLAYFTSKDSKQNTFTLGNVGITLNEETDEQGNVENLTDGIKFVNVLPGQTISKKPVVTVKSSSQPCYIRIKLELSSVPVESNASVITPANMKKLEQGLKLGTNWTYNSKDHYYYYGLALNANVEDEKATTSLFDQVIIPSDWGNATAGQTLTMNIQAEAVQSDYSTSIIGMNADGKVIQWNLTAIEKADLKK